MNRYFFCCFVVTLFTLSLHAQILPCLDSTAVIVDTVTASLEFSSTFSRGYLSPSSATGTNQLIWQYVVPLVAVGRYDYVIIPESITYTGNGSIIDAISTSDLFDLMAAATVADGVLHGYTPCTTPCGSIESARVSQVACVDRIGSGEGTQFDPCGTGCCSRIYNVCCPDSLGPAITLIGSQSDGCSGQPYGCETTCPEEEWELSDTRISMPAILDLLQDLSHQNAPAIHQYLVLNNAKFFAMMDW